MNKRIDLTLYLLRRASERAQIEQHFQYRIQQGRITSVRIVQPDRLEGTVEAEEDLSPPPARANRRFQKSPNSPTGIGASTRNCPSRP